MRYFGKILAILLFCTPLLFFSTLVLSQEKNNVSIDNNDKKTQSTPLKQVEVECQEDSIDSLLRKAENAYVRRQYDVVIEQLTMLEPMIVCIEDRELAAQVFVMWAVAANETGDDKSTNRLFFLALSKYSDVEIDSLITMPQSSSEKLADIKLQYADELSKLREQNNTNNGVIVKPLYVLVEREYHPLWINFLPFGAGQFQNHELAAGISYASIQGTSIVLTIVSASIIEYLRGDNFTFKKDYYKQAKAWQVVQYVGIAGFSAAYLASIIHGLINHESADSYVHPPSEERPEIIQTFSPVFNDKMTVGLQYQLTF